MDIREWNERIDSFIKEENNTIGRTVPVYRIYCQDGTDRSGGGFYNEMVTADTIGRFARALGDSNPLYSDPVYAKEGIYGGIVAPPLLECCICSTFIGGRMPRVRGISVYDGGTKWERFVPIRPGDFFTAQTEYLGVGEVKREDAGSRLLLRSHEIRLTNQTGALVSRLTARSLISCASPEKTGDVGSAVKKPAPESTAGKSMKRQVLSSEKMPDPSLTCFRPAPVIHRNSWKQSAEIWMPSSAGISAAEVIRDTGRMYRPGRRFRRRLWVPMMSRTALL